MLSQSRIDANRANAAFSTGPRTPEGKTASARNSTRHGLSGRDIVVLPEDQAEFQEMLAEYTGHFDPTGPVERELFAQLIRAAWTVRRSRRLVAALGASRVDPFTNPKLLPIAERYEGYYRHAERAYDRILRRLDQLRKLRTDTKNPAKRTQPAEENEANLELTPFSSTDDLDESTAAAPPPDPSPAPPPNEPPATVHRAAPKIGRNERCPCGSGLKYKRCCGA